GRVIDGFGSAHSSGLCAAMCDGSVHVISFSVDHQTFVNLCNRGDGQAVAVGAF
ncbi:MAG: DUF1559 domain-containing protein, partial [Planctomycetes bacterium]|nr:DUF1559 domain-containing protein [Planctomycetota bacterium]